MRVRQPAVAGMFYPGDGASLEKAVRGYLGDAGDTDIHGNPLPSAAPAALIAPHAGYAYSGPVAGSAFRALAAHADAVRRVLLLGPAHHVAFDGFALPTDDAFRTPLGDVAVDDGARAAALELPMVQAYDRAHEPEHSLEVELPFLQVACPDAVVLPLLVGVATGEDVAALLDAIWPEGDDAVVVVSSDLSHYLDYDAAMDRDARTAESIEALRTIATGDACGRLPINGLVLLAALRQMRCVAVDLRSSGDTAGGRDRVVGYGAFSFYGRVVA